MSQRSMVHIVESLLGVEGGGIKTCRGNPVPRPLHFFILPQEGSQTPHLPLYASFNGLPRILGDRSATTNILPTIPPPQTSRTQCSTLLLGWRQTVLHFEPTSSILFDSETEEQVKHFSQSHSSLLQTSISEKIQALRWN